MSTILVVANETIGGTHLIDAVRQRAEGNRFVLCVPQTQPKSGYVIYADAVYDAAQTRVDLAVGFLRGEGIEAVGEVGDPDPYTATLDAVHEHHPDAIIISTLPATRSGWLGRDLIERVREATRLPVDHVVNDPESEGIAAQLTLVVANRTAASEELLRVLSAKAQGSEGGRRRLFIVVVPQEGGDGAAVRRARTRLKLVLDRMREAGLSASGTIGDPDPYTAIINAVQYFHVDDIVISTLPQTRSGWLRADLIERVRRATNKPVEHFQAREADTATA